MKNSIRLPGCILIISLSCFFQFAKAQIVYTDVNPDQTCITDGCIYTLDLNNDGITDFTLKHALGTGPCPGPCNGGIETTNKVTITPTTGNAVAADNGFCSALDLGNSVDASLVFSGSSNQVLAHTTPGCAIILDACLPAASGNWSNISDKYLGVHLKVSNDNYYGWARLNVAFGGGSFTIKDYAYNSTPDSSILAGDMGIPLSVSTPSKENHFSVFPNPTSNKIALSFSCSEKKQIQITNTLGQIVFAEEINSAKEEIDVSEFRSGLYIVSWNNGLQWQAIPFLVGNMKE